MSELEKVYKYGIRESLTVSYANTCAINYDLEVQTRAAL